MQSAAFRRLFATSALAVVSAGAFLAPAHAQPAAAGADAVGEVVVTASRRSDTVHNLPINVTAVTPQRLERQGLKVAADLTQSVTALAITPPNSSGLNTVFGPSIAIRGIRSTTGSATTGIYVDDVPLQQRNQIGPTGGGVVFPNLFDLERVEVLKGPQGTLYGGSSEGGTIRFITPQPNFSKYSLYARAEGADVNHGGQDYEFGIAAGGPIVADKLAVRLSGWFRHGAGYIDHVSQYTGNLLPGGKDTNTSERQAFKAAIAWKPTDRSTVTLNYLYQSERYRDSDAYWENIPQYQASVGGAPGAPPTLYTYGPFNMFGPYKSGQNTNVGKNFYTSDAQLRPLLNPNRTVMQIPSLTLDYAFDRMNVKSVTSYSDTENYATPDFSYVDPASRSVTPLEQPFNALPNNSGYIATLPLYSSVFATSSRVRSLTEELRFSSNDAESPLSWVGGVFYNFATLRSTATITANTGALASAVLAGAPFTLPPFAGLNGIGLIEPQKSTEIQLAAFGEATYRITDKIKATAGIRYTRDEFNYQLFQGGALFGLATLVQAASGSVTESPITPKFGLQYIADPNTNFYVNAAKGYRPGGVNQVIPPVCQLSLNAAGYPNGAPATYGSDTVWSYEAGAKLRGWGGKAVLNASVFRIDWKGVQTPIGLACGQSFVTSGADARSQGADVESAFTLFPGFTLTANVAYTDAHYTTAVQSAGAILIAAGDQLPFTPKWTANLAAEYRFDLAAHPAYLRADYSYTGPLVQGSGPTTQGYLPDAYRLKSTNLVNLRAGVTFDRFEISAFVKNLFESQDLLSRQGFASGPGRVNCFNGASCTAFYEYAQGAIDNTFRPRTIGLAASYRY